MYSNADYPLQDLSYQIIGIGMEIHRTLGKSFLGIDYEREKEFIVVYKNNRLPHKFYADFVIENKIILEIKSKTGIIEEHFAQVLNYLAVSKLQLGIILNFHNNSLQYKRVALSK
jgi:GxxExxY protein